MALATAANLFDRNPLHVAHLQGPTERLPDANLRAVYERAGKILLIQRYHEVRVHGSEHHAFLLFETEQAAQACCSRIGALRVTSDRQNSRPITASPLSCTNAASNHILSIWLRSQTLHPSYVAKDPPPAPLSAHFPLKVLSPLSENYGLVVQMLRDHKCAPSWWRFVAQMYVSNKMWTAAQYILGQSTKSEEMDVSLGTSATAKDRAKETDGSEDIIDISDDSICETLSEPDESAQGKYFARMQKLQQKKAPPSNTARKYGNAWLTHKRPNVQNARAKLGIVTAKGKDKEKLGSGSTEDKSQASASAHESESEPEIDPPLEPTPPPAATQQPNSESIDAEPTSGSAPKTATAQTPIPLSQQLPAPAEQPSASTPAPSTPRFSTPAPGHAISPPFVPTPMLGTPIPSTPKHKAEALPSSSSQTAPTKPAASVPSTLPPIPQTQPPSTPKTQPLSRPPTLPPTPSTTTTTPSCTQGQGPTIASLVRPKIQSPGDTKSLLDAGRSKTPASPGKLGQKQESPGRVVLPALPAGMPQRPAWIPTSANRSADANQENATGQRNVTPSGTRAGASLATTEQDITAVAATQQEAADEDASMSAAEEDTVEKDLSTSVENDTSVSDAAPPSVDEDRHEAAEAAPSQEDDPKRGTGEPRLGDTSPFPSNSPNVSTSQTLTSPLPLQPMPTPPKQAVLSPTKSQMSPCSMQISTPTTQASSPICASASPTKRKSDLDTRGFEARLKRRRHRDSPSKQPSEVEEQPVVGSGPSFASLTNGPSLASLSSGPSLTSFTSLGDSVFGASITPLRASEEPLTPKETIRARVFGQHRSGSPLSGRPSLDLSGESVSRGADRRTPLSDMDPRTWKATLDENEALKMKIRVLELTLPTAETVKNELYAERKEKTELLEKFEIQRSLLVQSEALRKQSESTREELGARIKQLEDGLADSALALERARLAANVAAEQRRMTEEAARLADSERAKVQALLDAERALVQNEKAVLAKERETRAEAETKLATIEVRLAAEQRRAAEASEMAEKERAEAKNFLDAERAIVSAQEAKLEKEREIRAEVEARLTEVEEQLKEQLARFEAEQVRSAEEKRAIEVLLAEEKNKVGSTLADEKKAAESVLAEEQDRAAKLLEVERARVMSEQATVVQEREARTKVEQELEQTRELFAGIKDALNASISQERDKSLALEKELSSVKAKLADSEKEAAGVQKAYQTTASQLQMTEDWLAQVKAQLDATKTELQKTKVERSRTGDQATQTSEVLARTRSAVISLEQQLASAKRDLTSMKNELTSAQAQLLVAKTELATAQEKASSIERGAQQRDQVHQALVNSRNQQLNAAQEHADATSKRALAADDRAKAAEQMQRMYQSEFQRIQGILDHERSLLTGERTTLAKERIQRQEIQKKHALSEDRANALERQLAECKRQLQENSSDQDSREQLQTQRTLLHMARMRIQELEQALQRVEGDLDAARSAEATAKTMIQLGWGPHLEPSSRPRIRHTHSSPISDAETEFPSPREDPMDEDSVNFNPFIPLMKPPRQQSFKLKRTALPSRLLRIDMPSGDPVNIDLGVLPPNPAPVIDLLQKSQCAGVFWDIIMDEYGAMGGFEAAEAIASGKLRYLGSD